MSEKAETGQLVNENPSERCKQTTLNCHRQLKSESNELEQILKMVYYFISPKDDGNLHNYTGFTPR